MSGYLVLLSVAVLVCKVHSQVCSPPIIAPPSPPPCIPVPCQPSIPPCPTTSPQIINPNPYVTTIIDTSVSNSLVNALQLLIVSNLIGSTLGPSEPLVNNLGPLLDSLIASCPCSLDIFCPEYLIPPYGQISTCGSYIDLIPPISPIVNSGPYYEYIPPCGPTIYPSYELIPPCGPTIDPYLPCGLNDVYPNYITYTETLPFYIDSYPYGYGETILPLSGIDTIGPNYCGMPEIIPNYINYPIPECPVNPYCGFETIAPTLPPNVYNCVNEVLPPIGPLVVPNYCGLPEPEVIYPAPIPGPLSCNYGFAPPTLPCVTVSPLVNDNCVYGYGGPIYY